MITRRVFVSSVLAGGVAGPAMMTSHASAHPRRETKAQEDRPAPLDSEMVKRFVGGSHGNFELVKELVGEEERLVFSSWDWGNGDWESGLGAASHVGRRDIAEFLLESGARMDAYAASMLGMTDVVKSLLVALPGLHETPGPHGIPLLSHAVFGREQARDVFALLLEHGADVNGAAWSGITVLMAAASIGNVEAVEELLSKGADPALRDSNDRTALDWAKNREQTAVVELLQGQR